MSVRPRNRVRPDDWHALTVAVKDDVSTLHMIGDFDLAAAPDLSAALDGLDVAFQLPLCVDLSRLTFLDTSGVRPLVEAARRRIADDGGPVVIGDCSPAARYFLQVARLGGRPYLDVRAWDRFTRVGFRRA